MRNPRAQSRRRLVPLPARPQVAVMPLALFLLPVSVALGGPRQECAGLPTAAGTAWSYSVRMADRRLTWRTTLLSGQRADSLTALLVSGWPFDVALDGRDARRHSVLLCVGSVADWFRGE